MLRFPPNPHRILYTALDTKVHVCSPATPMLVLMERGGGWYDEDYIVANDIQNLGTDDLHKGMGESVTARMRRLIDSKIANGTAPAATTKLIRALANGGCTTAEALGIIKDTDCAPKGTGFERKTADEIPSDRWFRDAWRRSLDGGPIYVDMELARPIQAKLIEARYKLVISKAQSDRDSFAARFLSPKGVSPNFELDWNSIEAAIRAAKTPLDLKNVWPTELGEF